MKNYILLLILFSFSASTFAQIIHNDEKYVQETDPLVLQKLDEWQNLKFGLLMHWGPYSQWGIVESWSICPEDYGWCERIKGRNPQNYHEYAKEYEELNVGTGGRDSYPINFNERILEEIYFPAFKSSIKEAGARSIMTAYNSVDGTQASANNWLLKEKLKGKWFNPVDKAKVEKFMEKVRSFR